MPSYKRRKKINHHQLLLVSAARYFSGAVRHRPKAAAEVDGAAIGPSSSNMAICCIDRRGWGTCVQGRVHQMQVWSVDVNVVLVCVVFGPAVDAERSPARGVRHPCGVKT